MFANPYAQRWYEKHKNDPGFLARRRERLRKWRIKYKDSEIHKQRKAAIDVRYKLEVRDSKEFREKRNKLNLKYRSIPESAFSSLQSVHAWKNKNPEKVRAHYAVKYAVKVGKLVRPDKCEKCGSITLPARDGRSGLHAHHRDYSKKLDVQWLCAFCHGNERRKR